jgi:hypothetical protein
MNRLTGALVCSQCGTLDAVVGDLDNPADGRLLWERSKQPLGIGYALDEGKSVVGIGIAAAHDLLAEMPLDSRQAITVPLLSFGIGGGSCVARGSIGGVTEGSGLGGEASLA